MDCRRYEKWLTDAALEALSPAHKRKLDLHLAECAACRAQFEREQNLMASIDASLAQSLDVQLPAGFAARVRARLAEGTATSRSWLAGWIPSVAVALAVAVLAIVGWMSWRAVPVRRQGSRSQESEVRSQRAEGRRQKAGSRSQESGIRSQKRLVRRRHSDTEPQVLVDQSQWQAIVRLYNDAQSGRVDGASLVAKPDEDAYAPMKPIEIKPLEVPELSADLQPLDSSGGR